MELGSRRTRIARGGIPLAGLHHQRSVGESRPGSALPRDCLDYLEWLRRLGGIGARAAVTLLAGGLAMAGSGAPDVARITSVTVGTTIALNTFVFRFIRCRSRARCPVFYRVLGQGRPGSCGGGGPASEVIARFVGGRAALGRARDGDRIRSADGGEHREGPAARAGTVDAAQLAIKRLGVACPTGERRPTAENRYQKRVPDP